MPYWFNSWYLRRLASGLAGAGSWCASGSRERGRGVDRVGDGNGVKLPRLPYLARLHQASFRHARELAMMINVLPVIGANHIFFAKANQDLITILIIPIVTACICAILGVCQLCIWRKKKKSLQKLLVAMDSEYANWRRKVAIMRKLEPIQTSLCLNGNEQCYYQASAMLLEPRAVRNTMHLGGGLRVAKGIMVGGGNSYSQSHDEWRELSCGTLCITNKRIIFDGEMHDRAVKLSALTAVSAEPLKLAISSSTRQKTMLFTGLNGKLARGIITILRNSSL